MSYTKTTWSDGDIITANKMNNIETGVESLNTDVGQLQTDLDSLTGTVENLPTGGDYQELVDDVADIKADLSHIGLSDDVKTSLLACFSHVAWIDAHGQDYYDALEAALYADSYPRITAVFDAGVNVIYTDDALDTLKQYLTVKYFETKDSAGTVIASNDYTLSGVLTEGTSTVTVAYNEVRTSVSIPGVVDFYKIRIWTMGNNAIKINGGIDPQQNYSPSRLSISALSAANINRRRTLVVRRGKAQIYRPTTTDVSTAQWEGIGFYPIPVPTDVNHVKITMQPAGQGLYMHTIPFPYESDMTKYGDSVVENRIAWSAFPASGIIEKDLIQVQDKQLFLVANFRVNSSNQDYTSATEPTEIIVEFSEV